MLKLERYLMNRLSSVCGIIRIQFLYVRTCREWRSDTKFQYRSLPRCDSNLVQLYCKINRNKNACANGLVFSEQVVWCFEQAYVIGVVNELELFLR